MSENKTVIQGLELDTKPQQIPQQSPNLSGFYSRSTPAANPGTVVSGMNEVAGSAPVQPQAAAPVSSPVNHVAASGKPIVGFLYSVSRTMAGEFWPIYIGMNTIGNGSSCVVTLGEGTVSRDHAVLRVLRDKFTGKISAWMIDTMSTNGTYVNNTLVGASPVDCKNGDIITIGDNYQLYVVLIDASELNLKVSEGFIPVTPVNKTMQETPAFVDETAQQFNPWGDGSEYTPTPGTVGVDGSTGPNHGGTIPL